MWDRDYYFLLLSVMPLNHSIEKKLIRYVNTLLSIASYWIWRDQITGSAVTNFS